MKNAVPKDGILQQMFSLGLLLTLKMSQYVSPKRLYAFSGILREKFQGKVIL
jgi:hypothetical protein